MAEPLKNHFGPDVPVRIARMVGAVDPRFDSAGFVAACLDGYEELELTPRARHVAAELARFLPADPTVAIETVIASLSVDDRAVGSDDDPIERDGRADDVVDDDPSGMASFVHLPFVYFVAERGLDDFETSMRAQYELTKRFTAEFSIRAFLTRHPERTLMRLREWTGDDDHHVRRLVSEGTRPRLPWAPRLPEFQTDPTPVLELLERLRHDRSEYVRRSVANNLNDIAKDHPDLVVDTCRRWSADIDAERDGSEQAARERWMIRHALRTLVKRGDAGALDVLGFSASSPARVASASIEPTEAVIGGRVRVAISIENPTERPAGALVDLRVHFVKANGSTSPKVFKGAEVELEPFATRVVRTTISVAQQSTRTHHPGTHRVEALLNGVEVELGSFDLRS